MARPFCRPVGNRPPSKDQCDDTAILAEIESGLATVAMDSSDTYIFTWTSSASATGWWCPNFSIRTLGMLLLDMGVEGWIAQISLWTIAALEVTTFDVILGAAFAFATAVILVAAIIVAVVIASAIVLTLATATHVMHLACGCASHVLDHVRPTKFTIR